MFKKNVWIVGLITVLAIMFAGCVDPVAEETGGEVVEIFNLQKVIADVPDGIIATDDAWSTIFKGTPFMMCGGPANGEYSIITEKEVKKIKVDKIGPDWGVGFDLYNADANGATGAGFRGGDELYFKGKAASPGLIFNVKTNGEQRLGNVEFTGDFESTQKVTSADVGLIRGGNPQAIRIHYKNGNGTSRKGYIILEELVLKGSRSGVQDVYADDFTISGVAQSKYFVTGLKITPKKGKSDGRQTVYYQSIDGQAQKCDGYSQVGDADTVNTGSPLWWSPNKDDPAKVESTTVGADADKIMVDIFGAAYPLSTTIPQVVGTYRVKFDVAEVKDKFNAVTNLPAGKMYVFNDVPAVDKVVVLPDNWITAPGIGVMVGGGTAADFTGNILPGNYYWLLSNGVVTFTTPAYSSSFSAVANSNATGRFFIDFTNSSLAGPDVAGYKEVRITYNLVKTNAGSAPSTNVIVRNNHGTSYSYGGDKGYPDLQEGKGKTYSISMLDLGDTGISFTKNHSNTAVLIKLTKIEFIAYGPND